MGITSFVIMPFQPAPSVFGTAVADIWRLIQLFTNFRHIEITVLPAVAAKSAHSLWMTAGAAQVFDGTAFSVCAVVEALSVGAAFLVNDMRTDFF